MKSMIASLLLLSITMAGCATSPDKMSSVYVSPLQYRSYDCDQIGGEMENVSRRTSELYGRLKKTADNDSAQMAVGMLLFWPALIFLEGGDGPEASEYSRLKGEREALNRVAIQKKCDMSLYPPAIVPPVEEVEEVEEDGVAEMPDGTKYDQFGYMVED